MIWYSARLVCPIFSAITTPCGPGSGWPWSDTQVGTLRQYIIIYYMIKSSIEVFWNYPPPWSWFIFAPQSVPFFSMLFQTSAKCQDCQGSREYRSSSLHLLQLLKILQPGHLAARLKWRHKILKICCNFLLSVGCFFVWKDANYQSTQLLLKDRAC